MDGKSHYKCNYLLTSIAKCQYISLCAWITKLFEQAKKKSSVIFSPKPKGYSRKSALVTYTQRLMQMTVAPNWGGRGV